jgi:membrane dipeptidase
MDQSKFQVIDGHNDTLLDLTFPESGKYRSFLSEANFGHLDLHRARKGQIAGGFFAVFIPQDPLVEKRLDLVNINTPEGRIAPLEPPLDRTYAQRIAHHMIAKLYTIEEQSAGQFKVIRKAAEIRHALEKEIFFAILHFEGAEPIDPALDALSVYYQAGLRSLGIVWSRPNAFGHGVPFIFPHSPDIGPGLSQAGKELVKACNQKGIILDLAHLNEKGFWDVARISQHPLVVSHSGVHQICPSSRCLTDRQIDAIGESGGIIGVNLHTSDIRPDGRQNADTPLTMIIDHIDYIVQRIGIDYVAIGSDFDGAFIPQKIKDASGLPLLFSALAERGYGIEMLQKIAQFNWLRVIKKTWN